MSGPADGFGLNRAARLQAARELETLEQRLPIVLNPALPGRRLAFDWRHFSPRPDTLSTEPKEEAE
jgi:hypothetical protein